MMSTTEKERREFLDECQIVAKVPAIWHVSGDDFSTSCTVLPLSSYVYVGMAPQEDEFNVEIYRPSPHHHWDGTAQERSYMVRAEEGSGMPWRGMVRRFAEKSEFPDRIVPDDNSIAPLRQACRDLMDTGKLKIWVEASVWKWYRALELGTMLVLYSLAHEAGPTTLNGEIEGFGRDVRKYGSYNKEDNATYSGISTVQSIMKGMYVFDDNMNLAAMFCALLGRKRHMDPGHKGLTGFMYRAYELDRPRSATTEEETHENYSVWYRRMREALDRISVTMVGNPLRLLKLLIVRWHGDCNSLMGPLLAPLVGEGDQDFYMEVGREEVRSTVRRQWDWVEFIGLGEQLEKIGALIRGAGAGTIAYCTAFEPSVAPGDYIVEPARLLEPVEFKLPLEHEAVRRGEMEHTGPPTLELEFAATGPLVKINGEELADRSEKFFTCLLLLAATRKVGHGDGWLPRELEDEFGLNLTDRELYDLRKWLERVPNFQSKGIKGTSIIKTLWRKKKVRLEAFEPADISIDKSVCSFVSSHRARLDDLGTLEHPDSALQRHLDQVSTAYHSNTNRVKTAVELLGWQWHEKRA